MKDKKYKETKKLYSRKWRKDNKSESASYEDTPTQVKRRESRNEAHKIELDNKKGIVIHKNKLVMDNKPLNLKVVKKREGGGVKGNLNALKQHKSSKKIKRK